MNSFYQYEFHSQQNEENNEKKMQIKQLKKKGWK